MFEQALFRTLKNLEADSDAMGKSLKPGAYHTSYIIQTKTREPDELQGSAMVNEADKMAVHRLLLGREKSETGHRDEREIVEPPQFLHTLIVHSPPHPSRWISVCG